MLDPPMKRLMPLLLLAVGSFAGADDPAPPDHTQDLEVENCTVHSTIDVFTDEVLRAALNCRHPNLQVTGRFRVEYVYESGEHRLAVGNAVYRLEERRGVTLDVRVGRRSAFSYIATLSEGDAFVILTDALLEQFIRELTVDEPDVLIYRIEKGYTRTVPLPAEGMPMLIEEFQRRVAADQMLASSAPTVPASPPVAVALPQCLPDCTGASLFESTLHSADLSDADLNGATLAGANLTGADLTGADLLGATLVGADLTGADLTGANLVGATLAVANLTGADLTGADLSNGTLALANLTDANLSSANLFSATLRGADLTGADLTGADLIGVDLTGAELSSATLAGANLSSATLDFANLSGADLTGADLLGADLGFANLEGADLTRTNLEGAELGLAKGCDATRRLPSCPPR